MSLASSRSLRCPWQLWGYGSIWSISWKSVFWIFLEIEPWEPIFGFPLVLVLRSTAKHSTVLGGMISLQGLGNCCKNCPHSNDQHRSCSVVMTSEDIVAQHSIHNPFFRITFLSPFFHMPDEGAPRLPHAPSAHLCRCSDAPPRKSKWIPTKQRNFCSEAFPSFCKEFERLVQM